MTKDKKLKFFVTDETIKEMRERYRQVSMEELAKDYGIDVDEAAHLVQTWIATHEIM